MTSTSVGSVLWRRLTLTVLSVFGICGLTALAAWSNYIINRSSGGASRIKDSGIEYKPRIALDTSGFTVVAKHLREWNHEASLGEIANVFRDVGFRMIRQLDRQL